MTESNRKKINALEIQIENLYKVVPSDCSPEFEVLVSEITDLSMQIKDLYDEDDEDDYQDCEDDEEYFGPNDD